MAMATMGLANDITIIEFAISVTAMETRWARRREARSFRRLPQFLKDRLVAKLILAAIVLVLVSMIPLLAYGPPWAVNPSQSRLRTVIVIDEHKPIISSLVRTRQCMPQAICRNGKDGIIVVVLKSGAMPPYPTSAVVETDEGCAPDAYGNSHCKNRLQLANGREITVQTSHNMQIYPCLKPGEVVEVQPQNPTVAAVH